MNARTDSLVEARQINPYIHTAVNSSYVTIEKRSSSELRFSIVWEDKSCCLRIFFLFSFSIYNRIIRGDFTLKKEVV